jgi:hypothetical protein
MKKLIIRHIFTIHFSFFAPFCAHLASKFAKSTNITQNYLFQIFSICLSKNAEFDADKSVEKVAKKWTRRIHAVVEFLNKYCAIRSA